MVMVIFHLLVSSLAGRFKVKFKFLWHVVFPPGRNGGSKDGIADVNDGLTATSNTVRILLYPAVAVEQNSRYQKRREKLIVAFGGRMGITNVWKSH